MWWRIGWQRVSRSCTLRVLLEVQSSPLVCRAVVANGAFSPYDSCVALKRIGPDLSFYYIVLTETNGSCSRFSDSFSNTDKSIVFAYILVLSLGGSFSSARDNWCSTITIPVKVECDYELKGLSIFGWVGNIVTELSNWWTLFSLHIKFWSW